MKISENKLVILQYKLSVKTENGELELMEETTPEQPLQYFHGMGMMLPKFEENLEGLGEGDKFDFMIPVVDAYGEYEEESVIELPKNIFMIDGKFVKRNGKLAFDEKEIITNASACAKEIYARGRGVTKLYF